MPVGGLSHGISPDNEMLIKQDGSLQKRHYTQTMLHFSNILSCLLIMFFLLVMSMFFGKYCTFCIF